jgi:hypothetical protein
MPQYNLHIMDGKEVKVAIDAESSHHAIDSGVTALAKFAFRNFPPPENLSIAITDETEQPVATVSFAFTIDYAPGVRG